GAGCNKPSTAKSPPTKSSCVPRAQTETSCTDGQDDDCDGYIDCLDSDCGGKSCGGDGSMCVAGGCLCPTCPLPSLPEIHNVRVTTRGSTAVVDFEPVDGALDYRVYPLPASGAWHVDGGGVLVVPDGVFRCGGDRPIISRESDPAGGV